MRRASAGFWLTAGTLLSSQLAIATATAQSGDLLKMQANAADVVMPTMTYDNQRYSTLDQITAQNVGKLQVAWTFSTGVLRGHEGAPLVIGNVMYVHAPFPNTVFALDLDHDGKILWKYEPKQDPNVIPVMCCDTVNRGLAYADGKLFLHQADTTLVAIDAKTGKVAWSVKTGDAGHGETGTGAPMIVRDKVYVGVSGGEFGVRGWVTAFDRGRQADLARLVGRHGQRPAGRSAEDDGTRQADRRRFQPEDLAGRPVEDRWRRHVGLVLVRSDAQPDLLWQRQSLHLESQATARRQQVVDDDSPAMPIPAWRNGSIR
jgi:PQQ-dependent dehydrogenase (methanol/ethanol family)